MTILFVCNGNVARSQEAQVFFNSCHPSDGSIAVSGGINVELGKPIDPLVIEVMDEIGYDMSTAKRKSVDEAMAHAADIIISFKPANELPDFIKGHNNVVYWPIADPKQQPIEFHRKVRDEIRRRVTSFVKERGMS
jgi:arsenate reductase